MKLAELTDYLSSRLELDAFESADASLNGLQVGRAGKVVHKVVCAVDASLATFQAAAEMGADAIFVHHGLFWGQSLRVIGAHYSRLAFLIQHDIALLAAHLPLDAHPELGNNATIARLLNTEDPQPFGLYHGKYIGYKGTLKHPLMVDDIVARLGLSVETGLHVLAFGKEPIRTVGIVSGGAANEVQEALSLGLDAYITGEASHTMYPVCQEGGITMICGGHYATEVFGVQQVSRELEEKLGLESTFLALPTAL
jgi:dinuclear metal center YbgI/SA1388 family protein